MCSSLIGPWRGSLDRNVVGEVVGRFFYNEVARAAARFGLSAEEEGGRCVVVGGGCRDYVEVYVSQAVGEYRAAFLFLGEETMRRSSAMVSRLTGDFQFLL